MVRTNDVVRDMWLNKPVEFGMHGPLAFFKRYFQGVPRKELVVSKCDFGPVGNN